MSEQPLISSDDQNMPNTPPPGVWAGQAANGFGIEPPGLYSGVSSVYTTTVLGDPLAWQGTLINEYTCMTLPAVWRATSVIASILASLPKHVNQMDQSGLLTLRRDHYLEGTLNDEINPLNTPATFWQTFYHHCLLWGNGYAFLDKDPTTGEILGIYNLPPDRVFPFRYQGKQWYAVMTAGYATPYPVPADVVLHLPGLGFDGMRGYPVIAMLAQALRIGKAAEGFGDRFFKNGATGIGALETDKKLTPDQLATLKQAINEGHSGIEQAHKWVILSDGLHAKPFTIPPEQAQFLESRTFAIQDVSRVTGVSPHILFDLGRATWNNLTQLSLELVKYTLAPQWIVPSEQEIRRKLFTQAEKRQGLYIRFDVDALQRGDPDSQIDAAVKRVNNGLTTPNEERAIMGRPNYAGEIGTTPRVAANTVQLGQQAQAVQPPAQATAATTPPPTPAAGAAAPEKASQTPAVTLESFTGLILDASRRVHNKTEKATANAQAKFANQPAAWVPWCNTFSQEQEKYAGQNVAPIFQTYAKVAGITIDHERHAARIGSTYAGQLRGHLYAVGKGEDSTAPNLNTITYSMGNNEEQNG